MSDGMNKVLLLGNLGSDPELRYANNGTPILSFRMATNESYLDRNRDLMERTEWHSVVLFGARAEALSRHLHKGMCVAVEGTLRTSSYEKEGQKRYKTEIHVRELCFTGSGSQPRPMAMPVGKDFDDEIPPMPTEMPMEPQQEEPRNPEERPSTPRPARKRNGPSLRKPEAVLEEMPF